MRRATSSLNPDRRWLQLAAGVLQTVIDDLLCPTKRSFAWFKIKHDLCDAVLGVSWIRSFRNRMGSIKVKIVQKKRKVPFYTIMRKQCHLWHFKWYYYLDRKWVNLDVIFVSSKCFLTVFDVCTASSVLSLRNVMIPSSAKKENNSSLRAFIPFVCSIKNYDYKANHKSTSSSLCGSLSVWDWNLSSAWKHLLSMG